MKNLTFKLCFNHFLKVSLHYKGPSKKVLFIYFGLMVSVAFRNVMTAAGSFIFLVVTIKSVWVFTTFSMIFFFLKKLFSKLKVTFYNWNAGLKCF